MDVRRGAGALQAPLSSLQLRSDGELTSPEPPRAADSASPGHGDIDSFADDENEEEHDDDDDDDDDDDVSLEDDQTFYMLNFIKCDFLFVFHLQALIPFFVSRVMSRTLVVDFLLLLLIVFFCCNNLLLFSFLCFFSFLLQI